MRGDGIYFNEIKMAGRGADPEGDVTPGSPERPAISRLLTISGAVPGDVHE
jgi:hypothetical protein